MTLVTWLVLAIAATSLVQLQSSKGPAVVAAGLLLIEIASVIAVLLRFRNHEPGVVPAMSVAVWICAVINLTVGALFPVLL